MSATIVLLNLISSICSQWQLYPSTMFTTNARMNIAHHQNITYLVGGINTAPGPNTHSLMTFNHNNNTYTFDNDYFEPSEISSTSQSWVQIDHILYMTAEFSSTDTNHTIYFFNMKTKHHNCLSLDTMNCIEAPTTGQCSSSCLWTSEVCLAASNDGEQLYYIGGVSNSQSIDLLQILNLTNLNWTAGNPMQTPRSLFSCIISAVCVTFGPAPYLPPKT